ncbi:MAG: peptidylprolyl isomerase [Emcibacteraceae bacterium]|nr:peptidylprolyl isomerase [Emcibacteraceae bacterium]
MTMKTYRQFILKILMLSVTVLLFTNNALKAQQTRSDLQDVQQIIAIVNDELISLYDLKQRVMILVLSTGSAQIQGDPEQYFQTQAMNGLIDDKLKLQEAVKYDATPNDDELETSYGTYANQFNMAPDELEIRLNETGIQKESLLNQIRGTVAWQRLVGGLLQTQVNITDDEVLNYIEKLERDKGKFEYNVSEIFLLITNNAQRDDIVSTAKIMHEQLNSGALFSGVAQQFSQSSTASVGGDMGWIMESELPDEVNQVIPLMEVGGISEPIITDDGIYILKLSNKRKILTLNDSDIAVELKYIFFSKEDNVDSSLDALNELVFPVVNNSNACELNDENGKSLNATDAGQLGTFRVGELPAQVQDDILNLKDGHGTKLYEDEEGYRSFVLCLKDIPEIVLPEFEVVLDNMTKSRLQLIARRHLRDLRRDAIIDYR